MEVRILGPLEVVGDHGPVPLPRGRARALLAQLALRAGEVVSAGRLIDDLWGPSPPPTAQTALQVLVSKLRRRIEPDPAAPTVIVTREPGYVLLIDRDRVDGHRFRALVAGVTDLEPGTRAGLLRDALALWRGPALHDFAYEPFAQAAIADLEELRLTALEERLEAELVTGHHHDLVAELERLTAEHPLRERLPGQLMLALYRCGRQVDALRVYRDTRQRLVDELGVEPGPALQQLHRAILSQDPSIAAAPARPTPAAGPASRAGAVWLGGGRKIVTTLYADIAPAGWEVDLEAARLTTRHAFETAARVVERHGGTIEGFLGDVVVAVFGMPLAHEDDALRAVRAGLELREHLAAAPGAHPPATTCRVGINTGEVLVGVTAAGPPMSGQPITLAARLQQAAADGEVLVGEGTLRLVGQLVRVEPVPTPVEAWRVTGLVDAAPSAPGDSVHVGRSAELIQLREAYQWSVREGRAVLAMVAGEPGIGKSRLAREFARTVAPAARVVTGHCPSYGEGFTFWPLREIVRALAPDEGIERLSDLLAGTPDPAATAAVIASAVGMAEDPVRPSELFRAVRGLFEAVARQRPLVLILEDLHWAQPTLLDLIEHLAESTTQPLLLLCLTRPELPERWVGGQAGRVQIALASLSPADSERLLRHRRGGWLLRPDAAARLVALAQGNPLFLEQLLAALRENLQADLPATLRAMLTARLDRLGPAVRDLLRCASVIGPEVPVAALAALLPEQARPHLSRHLRALEGRELITTIADVDGRQPRAFRFRHVLIQRAAYGTLTRQDRCELHERVAAWLAADGEGGGGDLDELVGHHLEQAFTQRQALGPLDAAAEQMARRAGERLAEAGMLAYARFDVPAAENLLSRARALLPAHHPARPGVLRRLTEAYPVMGRPEQAEDAFTELLDHLDDGDLTRRAVHLERARFRLITGPDPVPLRDIREEAELALAAFRRADDEVGMSRACYVLAYTHLRAGRMSDLERAADEAIAHAERSGDIRERLGARWWPTFAILAGPRPVAAAARTCEELIEVGGHRHPGVMAALGVLAAMTGDVEQARAWIAEAQQTVRERIRLPRPLTFVGQCHAEIELLAGEVDAADRALRAALTVARQVAERDEVAQIAAKLSLLLSRRGDADEAAIMATLAGEQAPVESVTARLLAQAARARVLLGDGDPERAVGLSQQAVVGVPADMLTLHAHLHLVAAEILADAGSPAAVADHATAAVGLYERKGNVVAARQAARTQPAVGCSVRFCR